MATADDSTLGIDSDGNWEEQAAMRSPGKSYLTGEILRDLADCLAKGGSVAVYDPKETA